MCGRYYLETTSLVEKLLQQRKFKVGEIFPGDEVPILISPTKVAFRTFGKKIGNNMIFNARCETLPEKKLFKDLRHGLVLASSYYEWNKEKQKYQFHFQVNQYMCCVYDDTNFYIITTSSSHPIHFREPLFVSGKDAKMWLNHENTSSILALSPIELTYEPVI